MSVECGEWSVELEKVIEGLSSIHAVAVGDGAFYVTECGMRDFNRLLAEAVQLLKAQEANDAIPLKWMREKCKLYCSFGDYNKAAWINDLVQWWQRETREAQTHAETPEAVE